MIWTNLKTNFLANIKKPLYFIGRYLLVAAVLFGLNFYLLHRFLSDLNPRYELPSSFILTLNLSGMPGDVESDISSTESFLYSANLLKDPPLNHLGVLKQLERANNDPRVKALILNGELGPGMITANDYELVQTLKQFKKPIYFYSLGSEQRNIYISTVANEVYVHPMGTSFLGGFSVQTPYFKDLLDKVGVEIQVVKAGKYKSAVEPFISNDISDENTEQLTALLQDSWTLLANSLALSKKDVAQLNYIANNTPTLSPEDCVKYGFATKVGTHSDLRLDLRDKYFPELSEGELNDHLVSVSMYYKDVASTYLKKTSGKYVAILYLNGAIKTGQSTKSKIGSSTVIKQIADVREDPDATALVVRVNSPGGSALASELIAEELRKLREKKPVYISMGNVTASGGYWVSTAGGETYASPTTITGSIGVFGLLPNVSKTAEKLGIKVHTVQTHPYANIQSMFNTKSPKELQAFQKEVNTTYNAFIQKVSDFRRIPITTVDSIAQGRVWSGKGALEHNLIDGYQTLSSVISTARAKTGATAIKEIFYLPSFAEQFKSDFTQFGSIGVFSRLAESQIMAYDITFDSEILSSLQPISKVTGMGSLVTPADKEIP
jgi:protease IV